MTFPESMEKPLKTEILGFRWNLTVRKQSKENKYDYMYSVSTPVNVVYKVDKGNHYVIMTHNSTFIAGNRDLSEI